MEKTIKGFMVEEKTWKKEAGDYIKVILIFLLLRIVMVDSGMTFFHVPIIDKEIANGLQWVKKKIK